MAEVHAEADMAVAAAAQPLQSQYAAADDDLRDLAPTRPAESGIDGVVEDDTAIISNTVRLSAPDRTHFT